MDLLGPRHGTADLPTVAAATVHTKQTKRMHHRITEFTRESDLLSSFQAGKANCSVK